MQRAGHRADRAGQRRRDVGAGGGDDAGGEGGGVHAVLGGGGPVGVDGLDVLGVRLTAPADHEPLDDGLGLVDLPLRHHRQAQATRGLGDVGQGHDGGPGEVVAGLLVIDVEQRLEAPCRSEHGQRALHVDADVAGVDRDGERLGRRQPGVELAVDQQAPDVAERDLADQVLDVDAAVAEGAALLVGFGDLRLERDDSFESGYEVGHQAAPRDARRRVRVAAVLVTGSPGDGPAGPVTTVARDSRHDIPGVAPQSDMAVTRPMRGSVISGTLPPSRADVRGTEYHLLIRPPRTGSAATRAAG